MQAHAADSGGVPLDPAKGDDRVDDEATSAILGDIEAFLAVLEQGTMQAHWDTRLRQAREALARFGEEGPVPPPCDAAED